jgi:8-oxo-dGTP pyrophosphatase MutT (NUDIX family)
MNCGRNGHNIKNCTEPIISCGIICFNIDTIKIKKIEDFLINKFTDIEEYNYKNLNYINKIDEYKKNIKFLLIQRKHSISFVEFIRGKYDEKNITKIKILFELMSKEEVSQIKNNDFNFLWNKLWLKTASKKIYQKEFNISKNKFEYLKENNLLYNLESLYDTPEWGFPKGRRNKSENNIECANREFMEETNLKDYTLFHNLNCIEETFYGTDDIQYKHIYYIAGISKKTNITINDTFEVGDIGWYDINQVLSLIRPYNLMKKNVINQLYFFLTCILSKINNNNILLSI